MTKIYLVKFKGYSRDSQTLVKCNFEVFTNRKKAEIYCEYKNLQVKTKKSIMLRDYYDIKFEIEQWTISNIDWSEDLNKLQIENLPY